MVSCVPPHLSVLVHNCTVSVSVSCHFGHAGVCVSGSAARAVSRLKKSTIASVTIITSIMICLLLLRLNTMQFCF